METEKKVRGIVCEQLDVNAEEVKLESSFVDDLGADSLAIVEMILALEESFDITIPDEDAEKIRTFKDALDYISLREAA